ncbi:MAG TPA: hypothetical protein VFD77_05305 [Brumimicrobium sp.]|nr:hypothetical protein [Brumimicrobium sp.]
MELRMMINELGNIPFSRHLMLDLLKKYKSPNDKISELLKSGLLKTKS